MSLLTIVQHVADEVGLPAPGFVINNPDATAKRLLRLTNAEGTRLSRRHDWSSLLREASFVTQNQEDQGQVDDITSDFDRIVNQSMFNRTTARQVFGPLSPQEWQRVKSARSTIVRDNFRLRGGKILFTPEPVAGQEVYFEYVSTNWVRDVDQNDKPLMDSDTDVSLIDEDLVVMGVRWRFLKASGFDYAEEKLEYETQLFNRIAADGAKRNLRLDQTRPIDPGKVILPDGEG